MQLTEQHIFRAEFTRMQWTVASIETMYQKGET